MRIGSISEIRRPAKRGMLVGGAFTLDQQLATFFASGVKGVWAERSSVSWLYQESTGATPVSAATNPVGFGMSRDQGGARGPELVTNGSFSNGLTGWTAIDTAPAVTSVVSGTAQLSAVGAGAIARIRQPVTITPGSWYEVSYDISGDVSTTTLFGVGNSAGGTEYFSRAGVTGPQHGFLFAAGSVAHMSLYKGANNGVALVDNISLKEIKGNHQQQATPGFRPTYQIGPQRLVFDGVDDALVSTFSSALGSACTVGRAIPGTGAVITSGVNIGTSFSDSVTSCALLIADRALTAGETALWTAYLNQQAAS